MAVYRVFEHEDENARIDLYDIIFLKPPSDGIERFKNGTCDIELHPDGIAYIGKGELGPGDIFPGNTFTDVREIRIGTDGTCVLPENCRFMFSWMRHLTDVEFLDVDGSRVVDATRMFWQCDSLREIDLTPVPFGSVTSTKEMFAESAIENINAPFNGFGPLEDMSGMFRRCEKLQWTCGLEDNETSLVKDFSLMFDGCRSLESAFDVEQFDTRAAVDMHAMFRGCEIVDSLNLERWDMRNVADITEMFAGCWYADPISVGTWDTRSLRLADRAFKDCAHAPEIDVSGWDVSSLESAELMLENCYRIETADFSAWDPPSGFNAEDLLKGCEDLTSAPGLDQLAERAEHTAGFLAPDLRIPGTSTARPPAKTVASGRGE